MKHVLVPFRRRTQLDAFEPLRTFKSPSSEANTRAGQASQGHFVLYPAVTSFLCAAKAARTSPFSRAGTLAKSRLRPSSAATSSNSSGEILRSRWAFSKPRGVLPRFVGENLNGPPVTSHTQRVRMNLRPGKRFRFFVCHSLRAGFCEVFPRSGRTTAALKWVYGHGDREDPPSAKKIFCFRAACSGRLSAQYRDSIAIKNFFIKNSLI